MKINVSRILVDHIKTLQNARSGNVSFLDLLCFYGLPALLSALVYWQSIKFKNDVFGQSIAVFAIFSALLFSVQIALFGIFYSKRDEVSGPNKSVQERNLQLRKDLVRETNTNISYLIVISCISVTIFLVSFVFGGSDRLEPAIATFLYAHFMLTLLMIIKRVHALFQREYDVG